MRPIIAAMPDDEIEQFYGLCCTIGGYIVFPANRVDGRATINAARGMHPRIGDRIDLTLECIRRHYDNEPSPLAEVLARYASFFALFESFEGYADFFLLQDILSADRGAVRFFLPFSNFRSRPLPADADEYRVYIGEVSSFLMARNRRIAAQQGRTGRQRAD